MRHHYDWIIASHVIEHTPDFVGFLRECQTMLKPGGRLSLVVPDRRYCFDICRPASTPGEILQAHFERRTAHTLGTVWDHFSLAMKRNEAVSWARQTQGPDTLIYPDIEEAKRKMAAARAGEYVDVHNWRFTPTSFYLALHDLWTLDLIQLDLCSYFEHEGCEFFVQMEKRVGGRSVVDRQELIHAAFRESADILEEATNLDGQVAEVDS